MKSKHSNQLAYCYSAGIGISKDVTKAFKWFLESAIGENASAQFNLRIYYNGNFYLYTECLKSEHGSPILSALLFLPKKPCETM